MRLIGPGSALFHLAAACLSLGCHAPVDIVQTDAATGVASATSADLDGGPGALDGGEPDASAKKETLVMQIGTPGAPAFKAISRPVTDRLGKYNRSNLEYFERAVRMGFVPFKGWESISASGAVQGESERWMNVFLTDRANPYHAGARVTRWAHHHTTNTDDVLRQDVVFHVEDTAERPGLDISLRILEAADVIFISVTPPKGQEILKLPLERRAEEATFYADQILRRTGTFQRYMGGAGTVAYTWTFLHSPLEEGVWFSTDATEDSALMLFWASRVDGGISNGRLFFWCWKKPEMTSGKKFWELDGKHWFDGEAYRQLNAPHQYPPGWK